MKSIFFSILIFLSFLSCEKKTVQEQNSEIKISEILAYSTHPQGVKIKSGTRTIFLDKSKIPLQKIVLLNSSLIGYLEELEALDRVIAVASPHFIYSTAVHQTIDKGQIQSIGNEQKIDIEKIISLQPDAVFTNYISTQENVYSVLKNNGIQVVFIDEYLEQNPLEKSAYLLLLGELIGKKDLAKKKYRIIEKNYQNLKQKAKTFNERPIVMTNEMYGSVWYMPGGKSFLARLISDAGGAYILSNDDQTGAVPMSFEQVMIQAKEANIWVNAGSYTARSEMLSVQPMYKMIPAFKNGTIYSLTRSQKGSANDFFEKGNVRADWVLRDYITVFHPQSFPVDSLTFLHKVQ